MLKVVRFVNLVLAGLLAGNERGTKVAIHPSLRCVLPTAWVSENAPSTAVGR
jgi:hypothetical protein